jgi:hypothetical protein
MTNDDRIGLDFFNQHVSIERLPGYEPHSVWPLGVRTYIEPMEAVRARVTAYLEALQLVRGEDSPRTRE